MKFPLNHYAGKALLAAGCFGVAVAASVNAFANISLLSNPEIVARLPVGGSALASALDMDHKLARSRGKIAVSFIVGAANRTLASEPLSPQALRLRGIAEEATHDGEAARKLFFLSERVSRRDMLVQLWLIENEVARGDVVGAVKHYDIAMRTNLEIGQVLYPILSDALAEPEVRVAFAKIVRSDPPWLIYFVRHVVNGARNPENLADALILAGGLPKRADFAPLKTVLLDRLIAKKAFSHAHRYFASLPDTHESALSDLGFNDTTLDQRFAPLTWQLLAAPGFQVAGRSTTGNARHRLEVEIGANERGMVARRLIYVQPGKYRFIAPHDILQNAPDAEIYWVLKCADGTQNRTLWNGEGEPSQHMDIEVPVNCSPLMLELNAVGGSGQNGARFSLKTISLDGL